MFATKKFAPLLALLAISCGKHELEDAPLQAEVKFYNESSYEVNVHESSFDGRILAEKLASGNIFSVKLNPSNNYGAGTVFSIVYWHKVINNAECACGDVWTNGIDPNMQIIRNLVGGESYLIQIDNPKGLDFLGSFIKILNTSNNSIEFNHLSMLLLQAGNREFSVPSGKVGIYRVNADDYRGETEIKDYTITQGFDKYPFPELIAKNGYIYNYEFDGRTVTEKGGQKLTF